MGRKNHELDLIHPHLNEFHPSFADKLIKQLTEAGSKLLEEPIGNCVHSLFVGVDEVKFDKESNGYIKIDVIDWSSFSRDVTVKWSTQTKNKIYPIYNVGAMDITFVWCEDFPIKELKMNSRKKAIYVDSETFPIDVEYSGFIESDILFEIIMSKSEMVLDKQLIIDTIENAYVNWNINSEQNDVQYIKYMSYLKKSRNKYIFYFDLGSSGLEAIHFLIQSLVNRHNKDISKIRVKQA